MSRFHARRGPHGKASALRLQLARPHTPLDVRRTALKGLAAWCDQAELVLLPTWIGSRGTNRSMSRRAAVGEDRVAACDGADGGEQLRGRSVFERAEPIPGQPSDSRRE